MANTEVGLKIAVDAKEASEYLKKLKSDLKIAEGALLAIRDKFGETSKEAIQASKVIAELRDKIQGAKEQSDLFDPGKKFQAFTTAASQVAAGFSAVQGAMALAGNESEDLQKALIKVQGAMALSQGLSELKDLGKSYEQLKTVAVNAFSTMRKAMMTIGIGALVAGLGLIIANFDEFKKAIFRLIPGLESISKYVGGLVQKFTDFVGITSQADRAQDALTKTNKKANETIDAQIKILEAQGGKEAQIYALKRQRAENDLNVLRGALNTKKKLSDEELKQFRDLKTEQQVLDIQESNRKKKLAEDEIKNQEATRQKKKQIKAEDKKDQKKDEAEEKKRQEEIQKNTEENLKNNAKRTKELQDQLRVAQIADEKERAKVENQIKLQNELDAETERYKNGEVRLEQYLINLALIRQRYAAEDKARQESEAQEQIKKESDKLLKDAESSELSFQERIVKIQERQALENQIVFASEDERKAFIAENEKAITDIKLLEQQARIANAQFAADQLSAIAQLAGQDTAAGKALSIAAATISTYLSAQKAYESQFKPIAIVDSPVRGAIAAAVAVAAGIANIRKIAAVQVPSRGGGGGKGGVPGISTGAPMSPQLSPQVVATQVNTAAVNQMGNRAARAYVLNSDIQNEQQRNAYIERNASIG